MKRKGNAVFGDEESVVFLFRKRTAKLYRKEIHNRSCSFSYNEINQAKEINFKAIGVTMRGTWGLFVSRCGVFR